MSSTFPVFPRKTHAWIFSCPPPSQESQGYSRWPLKPPDSPVTSPHPQPSMTLSQWCLGCSRFYPQNSKVHVADAVYSIAPTTVFLKLLVQITRYSYVSQTVFQEISSTSCIIVRQAVGKILGSNSCGEHCDEQCGRFFFFYCRTSQLPLKGFEFI